jgi:hypothetical protein
VFEKLANIQNKMLNGKDVTYEVVDIIASS